MTMGVLSFLGTTVTLFAIRYVWQHVNVEALAFSDFYIDAEQTPCSSPIETDPLFLALALFKLWM